MSTSHEHCGQWERGRDCEFDLFNFYIVTSLVWGLTLIPLTYKAVQRGVDAPTGATTWCLALTALSATCSFLDNLLFLLLGEMHAHPYHLHMLTFIGSVFLVFALSFFAGLWCNVASALHSKVIHPPVPIKALWTIRFGYISIAVVHIPFAALKAVADVKEELGLGMIRRDEISVVWAMWSFISACCTLTFFSFLMIRVARNLGRCPNSEGFRMVTWVNFVQQIIYDGCLGAIAMLYYWGSAYNDHGLVQAAYYGLYFLLYWLMHAQVLVFFTAIPKHDALYAKANDVVGRSEVAIAPVRIRPKSEIEDISFSWEGGKDINILIEEVKFGVRKSQNPGFDRDPTKVLDISGNKIEEQQGLPADDKLMDELSSDMFREKEDDGGTLTPCSRARTPLTPRSRTSSPTPRSRTASPTSRSRAASPQADSKRRSSSASRTSKVLAATLPTSPISMFSRRSQGSTAIPDESTAQKSQKVCVCGNRLSTEANFCSSCGAKQNEDMSLDSEDNDEPELCEAPSKPISICLPRQTTHRGAPDLFPCEREFDIDDESYGVAGMVLPWDSHHRTFHHEREPRREEDLGIVDQYGGAKYPVQGFIEIEDDIPDELEMDEYDDGDEGEDLPDEFDEEHGYPTSPSSASSSRRRGRSPKLKGYTGTRPRGCS